jgi:hypothetical protein
MKIVFFSESNYNGMQTSPNVGRIDVNWVFALNAFHINIHQHDYGKCGHFDLGIYIIPKRSPLVSHDTFVKMKGVCHKLAIMQEAAHDNFQDNSVHSQLEYIDFVSKVDAIFCHNEIDVKYFKGIFNDKLVFINPTLVITDYLDKTKLTAPHNRNGVMIGGNMGKWYNGLDSMLIATIFNEQCYVPSMGRKQEEERSIDNIIHLPYQNWNDWMYDLSKCKYAVHLMRQAAAGSFNLNCSLLKIPCLGWNVIDTQRLCYPELSFEVGDMESVRKTANHLSKNKLFYDHVCEYAFRVANDIYSKENYIKTIKENYEKILSKP